MKYPLWAQIQDATDSTNKSEQDSPNQTSTCVTVSVSSVQQRDLADTGASVSATGLRHILHDFTTDTRYEITGYDGKVTKAAGEGYAHVRNRDTDTIEKILFVYTPAITGTIFSLEHHAQTHSDIHRCWTQEAIPSTNGGWITFYDKEDGVVSKYPTIRSKGVYYIQDMQFESALDSTTMEDEAICHETTPSMQTHRVACMKVQATTFDDFVNKGDMVTLLDYVPVPTQDPIATPLYHLINKQTVTKTEADILAYEVWHQRMAHCSETKLRKTQQHVDGIPTFQTAEIPALVRCRACDVASLKKAPKGPAITHNTVLQPGQIFHMDLGFFRASGNLVELYERKAAPTPKKVDSVSCATYCRLTAVHDMYGYSHSDRNRFLLN